MKKTFLFLFTILIISCSPQLNTVTSEKQEITTVLDSWHKAAANAQFDTYFNLMTADGVFIGTDPTENWQNEAFKTFSKPYFDKGKAWNFTAIDRTMYVSKDQKTAWFDELLDTQMKICRGSGVLIKQNGKWKIAHYVLSIDVPNDNTDEVVKLKTSFDDALMKKLKAK